MVVGFLVSFSPPFELPVFLRGRGFTFIPFSTQVHLLLNKHHHMLSVIKKRKAGLALR